MRWLGGGSHPKGIPSPRTLLRAVYIGRISVAIAVYLTALLKFRVASPGDILVTSGTGGLYPPNIPVAIVVRRQDDGALARPLADPGKVDAVSVLRPYTPDNIEASGLPGPAAPAAAAPTPAKAP